MKTNSFRSNKVLAVLLLVAVMAAVSFLLVSQAQAIPQGYHIYSWGAFNNNRLGRTPVANETPNNRPARATPTIPTASAPDGPVWTSVATAMNRSIAINASGELWGWGQGHTGFERLGDPNKTNWISVAGQADSKSAIDSDGHLYTWAPPGTQTLGRTGQRLVPQRVLMSEQPNLPNSTTWIRSHSGNIGDTSEGMAGLGILIGITNEGSTNGVAHGRLFAAGNVPAPISDPAGVPMAGDWGVEATGNNGVHFVDIGGGANNWVDVITSNFAIAALNTNGEIWTLGRGIPGAFPESQLGRPVNAANPAHLPRPVEPHGGTTNSWVSIAGNAYMFAAVHESGRLYTWGQPFASANTSGRYAHDVPPPHFMPGAPPLNRPGQVGTDSNWIRVMGGTVHFLAFNGNGYLYGWGINSDGQVGPMDNPAINQVLRPARIMRAASTVVSDVGGNNSIVLLRGPAAEGEFDLTKELQRPYPTPRPADLTFEFTMVARSFNDSSAANFTDNFPANSVNLVRTVTIDNTSTSAPANPQAGDIITLSSSTNLLEDIAFTRTGIFSWTISEVQNTPVVSSPSYLTFSQAQYELRVYVARQSELGGSYYIRYITLQRLYDFYGEEVDPPYKTDDGLTFVNRYTRVTEGAAEHFEIRKNVTGEFASSNETFTFEITLTRTGLCPENRTFIGRVQTQNAQGNWVDVSPLRTYTFTTGVMRDDIELSHNQRLIFDGVNAITIGSTFLVTELACPFHIASVRVYSYGTAQPPAPYYLVLNNTTPNQDRTTNTHLIGANRNAALFTNAHQWDVPTGLFIGNAPYALVLAAGLMFAVLLATKARKRIEELPIM